MDVLPLGPYRIVRTEDGSEMPWYIIPFDREGWCEGPETRKHLFTNIETDKYSDIYLFSHGWNNDWKAATARYGHFVEGFLQMRQKFKLPRPEGYRPLLVGLYWPSTALVTERERGPRILAEDEPDENGIAEERQRIAEIAEAVPGKRRERFCEPAQRGEIDGKQAAELAELLRHVYANADDELPDEGSPSSAEIVERWRAGSTIERTRTDKKTSGTVNRKGSSGPRTAGGVGDKLKKLLPRDVIRLATVYQMKDRAGKVGALGGRKLVEDILGRTDARLHLIGHSYGAKVLLSALATATIRRDRKAYSMLLLQPAVSHLCFAAKVVGTNREGGYRNVLERLMKPIFATYSVHDFPLRRFFHRALWRGADKGEVRIAAADTATPPNKYAALGGYGPRYSGEMLTSILPPPENYDLGKSARLYGIDGSVGISGHGDVSNPYTWWALYYLIAKS